MKIEMIAAAFFDILWARNFDMIYKNGIFKTLINYCVRQLDHGVGKFKF